MRHKILLDTNVLIATSTYYVSRDLSVGVVHPFYEQSMELIEFLKENLAKRIGIVTRTVEEQAARALEGAVRAELKEKITDRAIDFESFSAIQNTCQKRLNDILAYLLREPVDQDVVRENSFVVGRMYDKLAEKVVELHLESPAEMWTEAAAKRFRHIAHDIYKTQERKENAQLINLIRKPVEHSDKWILSEAIYLSMLYQRMETEYVAFYIASTDHHFSPYRFAGGIESRQVTERIKELFEIVCDWPQQIHDTVRTKIRES